MSWGITPRAYLTITEVEKKYEGSIFRVKTIAGSKKSGFSEQCCPQRTLLRPADTVDGSSEGILFVRVGMLPPGSEKFITVSYDATVAREVAKFKQYPAVNQKKSSTTHAVERPSDT